MASLTDRMLRAAKLDIHLYEEVEEDTGAMGQATMVVVLSSLAAGVGMGQAGLMGLAFGAVIALVLWYIWAFLIYVIGTKLLPEPQTHADVGQLLRTIGFASSPGLLRVLGFVPGVGPLIVVAAGIWMLVATVVAVRQALDYHSTWRAVGVCLIGWVVQAVAFAALMAMMGGGAGA